MRIVVAHDDDIRAALVFGSYATDRVGPESDLDLMLVTTLEAAGDSGLRHARIARRLRLGCQRLRIERPFVARARRDGMWIDAKAPR
ncbi:MAG: hypothetical protein NVS2B3_04380 [Vulcanimicrobiaceae bacterium]